MNVQEKELEVVDRDYMELRNIRGQLETSSKVVMNDLNECKKKVDRLFSIFDNPIFENEDFIVLPRDSVFSGVKYGGENNSFSGRYEKALSSLKNSFNDSILDWREGDWYCILFGAETYVSSFIAEVAYPSKTRHCYIFSDNPSNSKLIKSSVVDSVGVRFDIGESIYGVVLDQEFVIGNILARSITDVNLTEAISEVESISNVINNSFSITQSSIVQANEYSTHIISQQINKMSQFTKSIQSQSMERERLSEFIKKDTDTLDAIRVDTENETKKLEALMDDKKNYDDKVMELIDDEKSLKESIRSLQSEYSNESDKVGVLKKSNSEAEAQLIEVSDRIAKAKAKIDTYSLDLDGHLEESGTQLKRYSLIVFVLIAFLSSIFYILYKNGIELVDRFNSDPSVGVGQIILSRLPLITSTTLIVGTISVLLYFLVNHMVSLNSDRMNMLKAAILAEQISVSLANEYNLTPEERKEESKKIKVDLIMKLFDISKKNVKELNGSDLSSVEKLVEIILKKS